MCCASDCGRSPGSTRKRVSPWWMQRRLLLSGIRAISPAVDVTNYVMLELGHPMHAHDRSLITGGFRVRFASQGETVVTLDDVDRASTRPTCSSSTTSPRPPSAG